MDYHDYGTWEVYVPEDVPEEDKKTIFFYRNAAGEDWYATRESRVDGPCFLLDEDNVVEFVNTDINGLHPAGRRVLSVPGFTGDVRTILRKAFDFATGEFVDPPPTVPVFVTKAQAKIALYNAGLLDEVEAIVAAHPYPPVRIWYEAANDWYRANPYVLAIGVELGLTTEQVDDLFIAAALLV